MQLQVPARGWFWSETAPMSGHPIAFLAFLGFRITGHGCTLSTHLCYEIFTFYNSQPSREGRRRLRYSIPNSQHSQVSEKPERVEDMREDYSLFRFRWQTQT